MFEKLEIQSPKRNNRLQTGWEGFFPYYAGFPETFAQQVLDSSELPSDAKILDPWNGSGTTTYTASHLGYPSIGIDINPVMVVIARARLLAASEADSLEPLAIEILRCAKDNKATIQESDPLLHWYCRDVGTFIRAIETEIRVHLVGELATPPNGQLDHMSGIAATFYVALFAVCRELVTRFQSTNPTWLRIPSRSERKIWVRPERIVTSFLSNIKAMAAALNSRRATSPLDRAAAEIKLAGLHINCIGGREYRFYSYITSLLHED